MRPLIPVLLVAFLASPLAAATDLAYKKEGKGPGVVLIHAIGGSREAWADISKRLRTNHTVLSVDLPGHGESAVLPLKEGAADLDGIGAEIAKLIRKVKIEPALLAGHGIGGAIAIRVALADPKAVRGIILVDSSLTPFSKAYTDDLEKDLDANASAAITEFIGDLCNGDVQKGKLVKEALKVPVSVLKTYAKALGKDTLAGRGAAIKVPVALFASPRLIPDPNQEKESLRQLGLDSLSKLTVSYFVNAKHWIMWDDPDTFEILFNDFEANTVSGSGGGGAKTSASIR